MQQVKLSIFAINLVCTRAADFHNPVKRTGQSVISAAILKLAQVTNLRQWGGCLKQKLVQVCNLDQLLGIRIMPILQEVTKEPAAFGQVYITQKVAATPPVQQIRVSTQYCVGFSCFLNQPLNVRAFCKKSCAAVRPRRNPAKKPVINPIILLTNSQFMINYLLG